MVTYRLPLDGVPVVPAIAAFCSGLGSLALECVAKFSASLDSWIAASVAMCWSVMAPIAIEGAG